MKKMKIVMMLLIYKRIEGKGTTYSLLLTVKAV